MVVIVKVTMWLQGIKDKLFKLFMQDILRRLVSPDGRRINSFYKLY